MPEPLEPGEPIDGSFGRDQPIESVDPDGYWPTWWEKFLNDWRTKKDAVSNDGLKGPTFEKADWIDCDGAATGLILEAARRRHQQAEDRIEKAEQRAARLAQTSMTLLALTFVASGFIANRMREAQANLIVWAVLLPLMAGTIASIALAAIQAFGIDRVSLVEPPKPGDAAVLSTDSDRTRSLVQQEFHAARLANWTGNKKVNEFLQARAWLTRGVTLLLVTGAAAVVTWLVS